MSTVVSVAVVRNDPPRVFIAEDQDTLNWVLALQLIAATPGARLDPAVRDSLREALREERWADAVVEWIDANDVEVDIYSSESLHEARDVELAPHELQFSPLFRD